MKPGLLRRLRARVPMRVQPLEPGTWLVQRTSATPLRVRQFGTTQARTFLVVDRRASRSESKLVQRQLGQWLLDEHLLWVLQSLRVDCVLDVGANTGQYAQRLRRAGYQGHIVSFEPVAEFAEQLRAAARPDPKWQVHQYALGATDATTVIHVTPGRTLSSLLPATDFGRAWSRKLAMTVPETIEVRRLDSVLDDVLSGLGASRLFLKLDTQGYDLAVVEGAGERMRQVLALQSELALLPLYDGMPLFEEHLRTLREAGFDVTAMAPVGRDRRSLRVVELDVVMVRPGAETAKGFR